MTADDQTLPPTAVAGDRRAARGRRRGRFGLLLLALAASFMVQGVAPDTNRARAVVTVMLGGTLLLAFRVADMPERRVRRAAALLVVLEAAAVVAILAVGGDVMLGLTAIANGLLVALAPPAIVMGVLRILRTHRTVTVEVAAGALCLYLLVGLFFASVYGAIDALGSGPFFAGGADATASNRIYYSFTTLTTVGYGDLTARTDVGHTLSVTEALIGQVYLVTVVAVIMGNLVPRRVRQE